MDRTVLPGEQNHSRALLLWGASGHGKVVLEVARAMGGFRTVSFVDDACGDVPYEFCGCHTFGAGRFFRSLENADSFPAICDQFLVSIGKNQTRAACFQRALDHGLAAATLIHPSAVISESASLGDGTVVMARAVINADARIGRNCIVNTAAIVEHDCRLGDHVHLSPGVVLAGGVTVHSFAHIGIGAILLPGIEIGESAVIGAGAVVIRSVPTGTTVAGVPAKPLPLPNF